MLCLCQELLFLNPLQLCLYLTSHAVNGLLRISISGHLGRDAVVGWGFLSSLFRKSSPD